MASTFKSIQLEIQERVAWITLASPPLNLLSISMMKEIVSAVQEAGSMHDTCAFVLRGAPGNRVFTAGLAPEEHKQNKVFQVLKGFFEVIQTFLIMSRPVIASVEGAAIGAGCELVAFSDIVIAGTSAKFGQPEIRMGVFPPLGTFFLPKVVGDRHAREMIMTGGLIGAQKAYDYGLVTYVVPDEEVERKTIDIASRLARRSARSLSLAKRALTRTDGLPFEEAIKNIEDIYLNDLMSSRDATEGLRAFIENRGPNWKHK